MIKMSSKPTPETDWNKLTVVQIKGACSRRGLNASGSKEELVQRLKEYEEEQAALAAAGEKTDDVDMKDENEVKVEEILYKHNLLNGYHATVALKTLKIYPFKKEFLQNESFVNWLDECKSYNIKRTNGQEDTAEITFPTIEKGDAAFVDLKTNLPDVEVTHPSMTSFYTHNLTAAFACKVGLTPLQNTSFFQRIIHLKGLSPMMNTEEKLAEFFPEAINAISFAYSKQCPGHAILEFKTINEAKTYLHSVGKEINLDDEVITVERYKIQVERRNNLIVSERLLLPRLPSNITVDILKEVFPKAQTVLLVKKTTTGDSYIWSAEVVFENEADAVAAKKDKHLSTVNNHKINVFFKKTSPKGEVSYLDDDKRIELNIQLNELKEKVENLQNQDLCFGIEKVVQFSELMDEYSALAEKINIDTDNRLKHKKELPEPKEEYWIGTMLKVTYNDVAKEDEQSDVLESLNDLDGRLAENLIENRYLNTCIKKIEERLLPDQLKKRQSMKPKEAVAESQSNPGVQKPKTENKKSPGVQKPQNDNKSNSGVQKPKNKRSNRGMRKSNKPALERQGLNSNAGSNKSQGQKKTPNASPRSRQNYKNQGNNRSAGANSANQGWRSTAASANINDNRRKRQLSNSGDYNKNPKQKKKVGGQYAGQGDQTRSQALGSLGNRRGQKNQHGGYMGMGNAGNWRNSYPSDGNYNIGMSDSSNLIKGITSALNDKMKQLEQLQHVTLQSQQQMMSNFGMGANSGMSGNMPQQNSYKNEPGADSYGSNYYNSTTGGDSQGTGNTSSNFSTSYGNSSGFTSNSGNMYNRYSQYGGNSQYGTGDQDGSDYYRYYEIQNKNFKK